MKIKPEDAPNQQIISTHIWKETHNILQECRACEGCNKNVVINQFECQKCGSWLIYNCFDEGCFVGNSVLWDIIHGSYCCEADVCKESCQELIMRKALG